MEGVSLMSSSNYHDIDNLGKVLIDYINKNKSALDGAHDVY